MNTDFRTPRRDALRALAALAAVPALPALPALDAFAATHDAHGAHGGPPLPAASQPLSGESVYQIDAKLTDQDGRAVAWSSLRGAPTIASMFYSSCTMVCPMIFETAQALLRALPAAEAKAARVVMVSFDPARDSVEVLKKTAGDRGADERWRLLRADEAPTRKIAAVLGIQYRRLSDGEFNHSSTLNILDREGRIVARTGKLGTADPVAVAALRKAAKP